MRKQKLAQLVYVFFRRTARCFDRDKVNIKGTKAKDTSKQNHPENINETLKLTDDLANATLPTIYLNNLQLTVPSLSLSAAENNWRPMLA